MRGTEQSAERSMSKRSVCAAGIGAILASCTPISPQEAVRLEAYHRVYHAKGASLAPTLQDLVELGFAWRVNLADPAFPADRAEHAASDAGPHQRAERTAE